MCPPPPTIPGLNFCNVTVTITHPDANDYEIVRIWLPLQDWNGRFQATGGGGLATGFLDASLSPAVALGYAAASSEGGLTLNQTINPQSGAWFLNSNGTLNSGLLTNYLYRSTHDITVIGKALAERFYGISPSFSYYTGCSQGGRQGYFAALIYPDDFDGIMANSPVLIEPWALPMFIWPPVVMENIVVPPQCVFDKYLVDIIQTCDIVDGAKDGLVSRPDHCQFDAESLVGLTFNCSGQNVTITPAHAEVVSKILQGPRETSGFQVWWGLPPGALFSGLANTTLFDGKLIPVPFSAGLGLIKYLVFQDPTYDIQQMTYTDFDEAVALSGTYNESLLPEPFDLSAFRDSGGKLLTWHGMADQFVPYPGSTNFYNVIERDTRTDNGTIDDFFRLFLAPGAAHCLIGGYGPVPTDPLSALVDWVENGIVPDVLPAAWAGQNETAISRNLCPWPRMPTYNGYGNVMVASSFYCQ
jgi:feruloyl esterase